MTLFYFLLALAVMVFAWLRSIKRQVGRHHTHRSSQHLIAVHRPTEAVKKKSSFWTTTPPSSRV